MFDLLDPHKGLGVCVKTEYVLAWCPVFHPLFGRQHDYFQHKNCFDLLTPPKESRECVRTEYVLACCCSSSFILCDMLRDQSSEKLNLGREGAETQAFGL